MYTETIPGEILMIVASSFLAKRKIGTGRNVPKNRIRNYHKC